MFAHITSDVNDTLCATFIFRLLSWNGLFSKPNYNKSQTINFTSRQSKEVFNFTQDELKQHNCTNLTCFYHLEI